MQFSEVLIILTCSSHTHSNYARKRNAQVKSLAEMRTLVAAAGAGGGATQIADARPGGRFKGVDPEPRAGLRGGHMPGAKSVPFIQVRDCAAGSVGFGLAAAPSWLQTTHSNLNATPT